MIAKLLRRPARAASILLAGLALSSGCSTPHTLEPGTWRLKIETQDPLYKAFVPSTREVEVLVDWSEEEKGVEEIKAQYDSRNEGSDQPVPRVLSGDIREGEVDVKGYDQDWVLWLKGKIFNPRSMGGSAFARGRFGDDLFSGTWTMTKAEETE